MHKWFNTQEYVGLPCPQGLVGNQNCFKSKGAGVKMAL